MLNIVLAVVQAVVAALTAYLGVHLTIHPVGESAREKKNWKIGFVVCGLISVALIGLQAYRNNVSQSALDAQLRRIEKNTQTQPSVQVNIPPAPPPQVILKNENPFRGSLNLTKVDFPPSLDTNPFAVNLHLTNVGQAPIADAYFWEKIIFQAVGNINSQDESNVADKKAYDGFLKEGKTAIWTSKKAAHAPTYFAVGEDHWGTVFLHPKTEEITGVMHGTTRLYFFAYADWDGGKSHYASCRWLQPPTQVNYGSGENLIIHDCVW